MYREYLWVSIVTGTVRNHFKIIIFFNGVDLREVYTSLLAKNKESQEKITENLQKELPVREERLQKRGNNFGKVPEVVVGHFTASGTEHISSTVQEVCSNITLNPLSSPQTAKFHCYCYQQSEAQIYFDQETIIENIRRTKLISIFALLAQQNFFTNRTKQKLFKNFLQ